MVTMRMVKESPEPKVESGIQTAEWRGHMIWLCPRCPWDTMDGEAAVRAHLATRHAPPKPSILVADAYGREKKV